MAKKKNVPLPPESEICAAALSAMRQTLEPVTAKQLTALLKVTFRIDEAVLSPILDESIERGELHAIPRATPKGKPRYWDRGLVEFGRGLVVQTLDKKGPQPKAKVKKAVKVLEAASFERVFQSLIDSRRVCEHPPVGKSKVVKYGTQPPAPELYLKDVGTQLAKVVSQLTAVGVERDVLQKAVLQLVAESGLSIPVGASSRGESTSSPVSALDLLMLMRQVEPGAERGALVSARDLRRVANLDKAEFDRAVLALAQQGQLMLHRHDHASHLSAVERDELVTDGAGQYYVGMALRRAEV